MIPRRPQILQVLAPLALVLVLAGAGCKQGIGDRCEQSSDCASGMCTAMSVMAGSSSGRCVEIGSSATGAGGSGATGGSGGTAGQDGAAGSDGSPGDAEADGAGDTGADVAPGADAATDAVADGAADDGG